MITCSRRYYMRVPLHILETSGASFFKPIYKKVLGRIIYAKPVNNLGCNFDNITSERFTSLKSF